MMNKLSEEQKLTSYSNKILNFGNIKNFGFRYGVVFAFVVLIIISSIVYNGF